MSAYQIKTSMIMTIEKYDAERLPSETEKESVIDFLHEHLGQYGDSRSDIAKAVDFALGLGKAPGGFILAAPGEEGITGVVVVNSTGMKGYIPENILVYIATHKKLRGMGIGAGLMERTISETRGDIALHVEHDNPARYLYRKFGFTNKYLEMRYRRETA